MNNEQHRARVRPHKKIWHLDPGDRRAGEGRQRRPLEAPREVEGELLEHDLHRRVEVQAEPAL